MKFLKINGKIQKDSSGKPIVLPDAYENGKLVKLNGNILTSDGKPIVTGEATTPVDQEVPGLYDEDGNLVKTWEQLVEEGLVAVA